MSIADFNHHVQALIEFEVNMDKTSLSDLDETVCQIYQAEVKELWIGIKQLYKSCLRDIDTGSKINKQEQTETRA